MNNIATQFTQEQLLAYKKKLHSSIHWLLIYKEQNTYEHLEIYFDALLAKIENLNLLVGHQEAITNLFMTLAAARCECCKLDCDFPLFRKLVLDSHTLLDKIDFAKGV